MSPLVPFEEISAAELLGRIVVEPHADPIDIDCLRSQLRDGDGETADIAGGERGISGDAGNGPEHRLTLAQGFKEPPLGLFALRDVCDERDKVVNRSILPPDAADRNVCVDDGAVAPDEPLLQRVALCFAAHHAAKAGGVGGEVIGMSQLAPGLGKELFAAEAENVTQALVHVDPALGRRGDGHADHPQIEEAMETLLIEFEGQEGVLSRALDEEDQRAHRQAAEESAS